MRETLSATRRNRAAGPASTNDPETIRAKARPDQRIQWLHDVLQSAVVIDPTSQPTDKVQSGATVTVRHRSGETSIHRIVGVDETDSDRGWISWLSPIAKAMTNARVGQRIRLRLPGGDEELKVLRIEYHE